MSMLNTTSVYSVNTISGKVSADQRRCAEGTAKLGCRGFDTSRRAAVGALIGWKRPSDIERHTKISTTLHYKLLFLGDSSISEYFQSWQLTESGRWALMSPSDPLKETNVTSWELLALVCQAFGFFHHRAVSKAS